MEGTDMRIFVTMMLTLALLAGCTQVDENSKWNPRADYPPWAYDAPFYYRPTEDIKPFENIGPDIPIYYTNNSYYFIKHPGNCQLAGVARVAIFCSLDEGESWQRNGFYGVEQTHFLFQADQDGRHWIRFVGPGQGVTQVPKGQPHRIYVVDTKTPIIELQLTPATEEKDPGTGQTRPHIYKPGDSVILKWSVSDVNLKEGSIRLGTCFANFPDNLIWSKFPKPLPPTGEMKIEIPAESAGKGGGLRFRMEATDKAGNIGMALTDTLRVAAVEGGPSPTTRPADIFEQVSRRPKTPAELGWPTKGELVRGGTSRILGWLPKDVEKYQSVELQFSPDDGRSWQTLATDLKAGKPVKWSVPMASSKISRLRIVGVKTEAGQIRRFMLSMTSRFTVDTIMPGTIYGPRKIQSEE